MSSSNIFQEFILEKNYRNKLLNYFEDPRDKSQQLSLSYHFKKLLNFNENQKYFFHPICLFSKKILKNPSRSVKCNHIEAYEFNILIDLIKRE